MERHTATIRVEVTSESQEARDLLLAQLIKGLNKRSTALALPDIGSAVMRRATLSRVRPAARKAKK